MRKLICLFLLTALLLSTLAACNASDKTPDGTPDAAPDNVGNDTSADTTTVAPPETTTALPETTEAVSTDTTVVPDATEQNAVLSVNIISPDDIDLSGIKIDVYEYTFAQDNHWPRVFVWDTEHGKVYDPTRDLSHYFPVLTYLFSVYTDENGKCEIAADVPEIRVFVDYDSLPEQYGIRVNGEDSGGGYDYAREGGFYVDAYAQWPKTWDLALEKIEVIDSLGWIFSAGIHKFHFNALLWSKDREHQLFANHKIVNGRFDDTFVQAVINGDECLYTATVVCGELSQKVQGWVNWKSYIYWEWRVQYLYYNNYITQEQYDNIVATTPPSEIGTIM